MNWTILGASLILFGLLIIHPGLGIIFMGCLMVVHGVDSKEGEK